MFLELKRFDPEREVNPLAWHMDEKGGTLLSVAVKKGCLGKRRIGNGIVSKDDPEQREALLDLIRRLIMTTPNRWVLYATWYGWDDEIREIRRVGERDDEKLAAAEDDVWYRFEGPPVRLSGLARGGGCAVRSL